MWKNALDSDVVKWFINLGTSIIKVVDSLGLIPSILGAIGLSKFVPWVLKLATHTNTFGVALATILKPLVRLKGSGQTLAQVFSQTAADAMNAAGGVSTFSAYLKAAGTTLKAFVSTPLGWFTIAAIAIGMVVSVVDLVTTSTKELEEELDNLKSELSDTQSELDSVNSELETTQERMAELLALPSLSFVQQEELKKLQKAEKSLENIKQALTAEQERNQKRVGEKAAETVESQLKDTSYNGKWYDVIGNAINRALQGAIMGATTGAVIGGVGAIPGSIIGGATGIVTGVGEELIGNRISTEDKLIREIEGYDELIKRRDELQEKLTTANQEKGKFLRWETDSEYDKIKEELDDVKKEIGETESYIDTTFKEIGTPLDGVGYGQGADEALDFYNQTKNRWEITYGTDGATASAIEDVISKDKYAELSNQIDSYVKKLKDGDESAASSIQSLIEKNTDFVNELEANGVKFRDAIDYFTLETGVFDSSTVEGVLEQYQKGVEVLQRLHPDKTQIEEELKQYGKGGTVDLLNRPKVNATKLVKAGWKDAGDGIATVFSSTYSNEDGTIAINFTPILSEDEVLSPEALQKYAEGVIAGVPEDNLNLQIGAVFEGEDAITQAVAAAEEIHNLQDIYYLPLEIELEDGTTETIEWGDLFTKDDEDKWVAQTENIAKVLNGCDETTIEQFTKLAESVRNGEMEVEEAVRQLQLTGLSRAAELIENEFEGINKSMFKGLDDDISGLIDTFDELSSALENTASAMDTLDAAQTQMKNSNQISIKTALELISQTENWADVIDISNGKVVLAKGAEEALINERIQLIKTNLETARSQLVTQLATLNAAKASTYATSADITNAKAQKTYQEATKQSTAVTTAFGAVIGTLANALVDADTGEWRGIIAGLSTLGKGALTSAFSEAYSSAIKTLDSQEPDLPSEAELEKQINNIDAMLGMVGNISTPSDFAKNYDYSKTPGDKYEDKDSDKDKKTAKDRFDELAAKYDRKISTLQYKKDLIQSEIDKAEARGEVASEAFYQRQIALEEQNKQALINKKKALEDYLKSQGKNMTKEEWAEAQEEINNTALSIEECEKNVIDLGQAIDDIHWEYFDKFTSEVDNLSDENSTMLSLVGDTDDAVDKNGNWTTSGITQIGLNAQNMQHNLEMAKQMEEEKKSIQGSWDAYQQVLAKHGGDPDKVTKKEKKKIRKTYDGILITSESEYQERMQDATKRQRDYAKAVKGSEDAIEELVKAQVDKEVEAIEKQIEAYEELINLKKKELDAERDLYEFKKNVDKQSSDIAETQRKIASLSGSTDASDIAELRRLQATLREQQSDLNDTYYDHAKDAQQDALDDELEVYEKSQRDKIKVLEETLKDAETLIANALLDMITNMDVVHPKLKEVADQYGITLSDALVKPWKDAASKPNEYKEWLKENVPSGVLAGVTDKSGVITLFSKGLADKLKGPWDEAKTAVGDYVKYLGKDKEIKNLPSIFTSWSDQIQGIANKWDTVKKAANEAAQAQIDAANVNPPRNPGKNGNNGGGSGGGTGDTGGTKGGTKGTTQYTSADVKALQEVLNSVINAGLKVDGSYGNATKEAVKKIQRIQGLTVDGYYGSKTRKGLINYIDSEIKKYKNGPPTAYALEAIDRLSNAKKKVPKAFYAKGTLSTKKDQFAITDESWIGEEITLAAGKNGQLQYLKKGSSVMPADISENLVEWGKLNPNMMNMSSATQGINLMSNYINKPELKIDVENLLRCDNVSENTLPELKKFVTQELDNFARKLNYSLKKFK